MAVFVIQKIQRNPGKFDAERGVSCISGNPGYIETASCTCSHRNSIKVKIMSTQKSEMLGEVLFDEDVFSASQDGPDKTSVGGCGGCGGSGSGSGGCGGSGSGGCGSGGAITKDD